MNIESKEKFEGIKNNLPIIIIVLLAVVIVGLLIYSFVTDTPIYIISKLYNYAVNKIVSLTGLSQWLVKGIVIIALIPMLWVIPNSIKGKYKKQAKAAGMLYIGVFFLSLYFMSKDIYFSHAGDEETFKWYSARDEGYFTSDTPGKDPVTGYILKPVTPEVARKIKLWKKGKEDFKRVDPRTTPFFNPISNNPEVWYYRHPDGTWDFYNKPGSHPDTGNELKPITPEAALLWKQEEKKGSAKSDPGEQDSRSTHKTPDYGGQGSRLPEKVQGPPPLRERKINAEELKDLINPGAATQSGKSNVALVLASPKTGGGTSPDTTFYGLAKSDKVNLVSHYFKEGPFISRGYFDEIYNGNTDLLKKANVFSKVDFLLMGRFNYSFKKTSQYGQELVSCDFKFSYKIINKEGSIIRSEMRSVVGPGFSEDEALQRAAEIFAEKHLENILKPAI
jgi:hypothetical protein